MLETHMIEEDKYMRHKVAVYNLLGVGLFVGSQVGLFVGGVGTPTS